jgi:hypothetical protein
MFGEVLGLKIQDRLDAERFTPTVATLEPVDTRETESFRMRGLFGEIPGSSYEPIKVESWSAGH